MGHPKPKLSDHDFMRLFKQHGAQKLATMSKVTVRNIYKRRANLENEYGFQIQPPGIVPSNVTRRGIDHPQRLKYEIVNGVALIGSDAHYWPGPISTGHRAFVHFCKHFAKRKELKLVCINGDAMDFPQISRHPAIGWEEQPTVQEEIEFTQERLAEIERAAAGAEKSWNLGNHDGRFETRLATVAPEFARIAGFHLKDHFPQWEPAWATWINDDVVIKHRFKGGMYAPQNNTLWSGVTTVTGHLHSAKIMPITDYNGTRFGIDTGCLASTDAKAFVDYTEDNPKNWRSAFLVLTFKNRKLLWPELVVVWDEHTVQFRGELIKI